MELPITHFTLKKQINFRFYNGTSFAPNNSNIEHYMFNVSTSYGCWSMYIVVSTWSLSMGRYEHQHVVTGRLKTKYQTCYKQLFTLIWILKCVTFALTYIELRLNSINVPVSFVNVKKESLLNTHIYQYYNVLTTTTILQPSDPG